MKFKKDYLYHVTDDKYGFDCIGCYENKYVTYYEFKVVYAISDWINEKFSLGCRDEHIYLIEELGHKDNNLEYYL